jgi:hypothetical protein
LLGAQVLHVGFGRLDVGNGLIISGLALIELLSADDLLIQQTPLALEGHFGDAQGGAVLFQLRAGLIILGINVGGVDFREKLAFLHPVAYVHKTGFEIPVHARVKRGGSQGFRAAGQAEIEHGRRFAWFNSLHGLRSGLNVAGGLLAFLFLAVLPEETERQQNPQHDHRKQHDEEELPEAALGFGRFLFFAVKAWMIRLLMIRIRGKMDTSGGHEA